MKTRQLGAGGPHVGAVGLGGMYLSIRYTSRAGAAADRPPEDEAIAAIHAALDAGMTLVDTADVYCFDDSEIGHNERLVAKALGARGAAAANVVVATKGGLRRPGGA